MVFFVAVGGAIVGVGKGELVVDGLQVGVDRRR